MTPDATSGLSAGEVITLLDLQPHPEGGHYRETFRDPATDANGRSASTAIHFLLGAGEVSAWHRVDATEIWHFHCGGPLALTISGNGHDAEAFRLGVNLSGGERPHVVVPANAWQTAETLGRWTLVSCTVAPGFEFAGFEMAPADWRPMPRQSGG